MAIAYHYISSPKLCFFHLLRIINCLQLSEFTNLVVLKVKMLTLDCYFETPSNTTWRKGPFFAFFLPIFKYHCICGISYLLSILLHRSSVSPMKLLPLDSDDLVVVEIHQKLFLTLSEIFFGTVKQVL